MFILLPTKMPNNFKCTLESSIIHKSSLKNRTRDQIWPLDLVFNG